MNVPATSELQLSPVFLIGPARSGSTFLLRLLNCFDGITVWGEHGGFVGSLAESFASATSARHSRSVRNSRRFMQTVLQKKPVLKGDGNRAVDTIEWLNPYLPEQVAAAYRTFFINLFAASLPINRRWGFKEIRYGLEELTFLSELFPAAQFVLLVRHPAAVLRGQIDDLAKGKDRQTPRRSEKLLRMYQGILKFAEKSNRARVVEYEQLTTDPMPVLQALSDFLNAGIDIAAVEQILTETKSRGLGAPPPAASLEMLTAALADFAKAREVSIAENVLTGLAESYISLIALARSSAPQVVSGKEV